MRDRLFLLNANIISVLKVLGKNTEKLFIFQQLNLKSYFTPRKIHQITFMQKKKQNISIKTHKTLTGKIRRTADGANCKSLKDSE